jgi:hypothetical protein
VPVADSGLNRFGGPSELASLSALAIGAKLANKLHRDSIVTNNGDTMIEKPRPYSSVFGFSARAATALYTWDWLMLRGNCLKPWRNLDA